MGFNYQSIVQCYITILNLHRDRVELEQGKTSINSCQADPEKVWVLKALGTGRNKTRVNFKLHGGQGFLNFKYLKKKKYYQPYH